MLDDAKQSWLALTTTSLAAHLDAYTADQCRALAELLYDVSEHPVSGTLGRIERILYTLLRQQDIDEGTAVVIAKALPHVDWSRIFVGSRGTCGLLDATPPDLLKYRRAGNLVPAVEHRTESRIETLAYSLADVLEVVAMDRLAGARAAGKRRFWWRK